eukprot:51447-Pyramimonas_sp.AAC.1
MQSVSGAPAHVTAHIGEHVGPHHPCRNPLPISLSGGPAHSRPYATTPAVPDKNHLAMIAGDDSPARSRQYADTPAVP